MAISLIFIEESEGRRDECQSQELNIADSPSRALFTKVFKLRHSEQQGQSSGRVWVGIYNINVLMDIQVQIQSLICLDVFEVPSCILCIFNLHVFLEEAFPCLDRRGDWRGQRFLVTYPRSYSWWSPLSTNVVLSSHYHSCLLIL